MDLNRLLTVNYKAGATINPYRIVKFGADDQTVIQAAGATDALIGISDNVGYDPTKTNNRYPQAKVDVTICGVAQVLYGGTVTAGALLTSDATGRAIVASALSGLRTIGFALAAGVVGDIGSVLIFAGNNSFLAPVLGFTTVATLSTADVVTYTAAQLLGGLILRDPNGGGRSDVSPTAALIVAAIPGATVGQSFEFTIRNTADAAETITVTAGAGVTLSGTMTIAQNNSRRFLAVLTNVGAATEAVTIYSLGTLVH